jgi:hypothetical protein
MTGRIGLKARAFWDFRGAKRDERGAENALSETSLGGLLVVSAQPPVELAGGVFEGGG